MKLTIFYDGQFWVGVAEQYDGTRLRAWKYLFGAEPVEGEILYFVNHILPTLLDETSESVYTKPTKKQKINPKRLARQVAQDMRKEGVSTAAQEAIKKELMKRKAEKKIVQRVKKDEVGNLKWEIKRKKAKAKHRGR